MGHLKLYNTLSRKIEEFKPVKDKEVSLYTCGPTVYYYPQIGNWRTFVFYDSLRRSLEYNGYKVTQVMNATDVGHLTGDNMGDADLGVDRMEKAAKREGKTAWDIANFYIDDFQKSLSLLNIEPATFFVRATDHINEQISLIQTLITKDYAYVTKTAVYFNVGKFPGYGKLGGQKMIDKRTASREEIVEDETKKHPADFALWKFSSPEDKRQMEWDSPWGKGFPGWHIECSAMAIKYLGETLDIHTGGIDHVAIHHTNEIAQSEGATGKPFSNFWLHGEFLLVDGGRMGKSLGNAYTLQDVINKGFDPAVLRYFYLTAHYRQKLNFTWEALEGAQKALDRLRMRIASMRSSLASQGDALQMAPVKAKYKQEFINVINDDLNMPQALALVWKLIDDRKIADGKKLAAIFDFDRVLGLCLEKAEDIKEAMPKEVRKLIDKRESLRGEKRFNEADEVRKKIEEMGYRLEDAKEGVKLTKM